jgi:hypothetical protein
VQKQIPLTGKSGHKTPRHQTTRHHSTPNRYPFGDVSLIIGLRGADIPACKGSADKNVCLICAKKEGSCSPGQEPSNLAVRTRTLLFEHRFRPETHSRSVGIERRCAATLGAR